MKSYTKSPEAVAALTPEQYQVTQHGGTERAGTGEYLDNHEPGIYVRIPMNSATNSSSKPPGFPIQTRHRFRSDSATTLPCPCLPTSSAELSTAAGGRRLRRTHDRCGGQLVSSAQDVLAGLRRHTCH